MPTKTGQKLELLKFHGSLYTAAVDIVRDCEWQKIRRLLLALEEEKTRLRSEYPAAIVDIGIDDFSGWGKGDCKLTRESGGGPISLELSEYLVNSGSQGFFVYFVREADGVWRLESMCKRAIRSGAHETPGW